MTQILEKRNENALQDNIEIKGQNVSINAIKINTVMKLDNSIKSELKKRFKCHWKEEEHGSAYTCPIENKPLIDSFLTKEKIEFSLSEIHDSYFDLSPNLQKADRMAQAKMKTVKDGIQQLKYISELIKDYNVVWGEKLTIKAILDASEETFVGLTDSKNSKQIENLKSIFTESRKLKDSHLNEIKINRLTTNLINDDIKKLKDEIRHGDYIVNESGLYYYPLKKIDDDLDASDQNKEPKKTWISSPIWPEAYLRDKNGRNHTLLIKVYDGEKYHQWAMPRRLILTKWSDVSEALLDLGQKLSTNSSNQKHIQNFLMHAHPEKFMRCVTKSGWHGEQYIFPDGEVLGNTKNKSDGVFPINESCPKGIEKRGSLSDWRNNVLNLCVNNSRLIFSIGVSFSAPCLELVGDEGGIFNFKGHSSIGKTRCLMIAVSIFGSPEFQRGWKVTTNGLEGVCSLHNDCLLALDEFGQVEAKDVGEIAYMYAQGMGKQRSDRSGSPREPNTWKGMLLSTGEVGISNHMPEHKKAKAGQLVRVIDIPAQVENAFGCFEDLHGLVNGVDGERFAAKIKEVCSEYYGSAGREFIKAIIEFGVEKAKKHLKFSRDDFAASVARNYDGQVKRVANRFGLVYAALSLGVELGILSEYLSKEMCEKAVKHCFAAWLSDRGTTGSFESLSIVDQIIGLLNENSDSKFISKHEMDDKRIRITLWGYRDGMLFYVFPKAFNESLCNGLDLKTAKETLVEKGLLINGSDGKFSRSVSIPAHGTKTRYYVIDMNSQDNENDSRC